MTLMPHNNESISLETPAEAYKRLVEDMSANAEQKNGCDITTEYYNYLGIGFSTHRYEPHHTRTYMAEVVAHDGSKRFTKVIYPKIAFIHGLASSELYFREQAMAMAKLGIGSEAISLPAITHLRNSPDELLEWQIGAVKELFYTMSASGNDVVLIGHSRGAQISTLAARDIKEEGDTHLAGLMLQGPAISEAMRVKTVKDGLGMAALVGFNSLINHPGRGINLILDIGKTVASRPEQIITEARQAMNTSIRSIILQDLKDLPVDIEYARGDEFTTDMYDFVVKLLVEADTQDDRTKPITVIDRDNTNHMLSTPSQIRDDINTLSDPRMSSGHILSFLQSSIELYSPLAIRRNPLTGIYEVTRSQIQQDMAA